MKNQTELTNYLIKNGALKDRKIIDAFNAIDRKDFMQEGFEGMAYFDRAAPIGHGQTISQPTVVATMLELLSPKAGERILDIGSGSGWTTVLLAHIVGAGGMVYGVELESNVFKFGSKNVAKYTSSNIIMKQASSNVLGLPDEEPFDRILVSAASDEFPEELISQFTRRVVIPVGNSIWVVDKVEGGKLTKRAFEGYVFVPLIR